MHSDHNVFVRGIREKKKIQLTFFSKEDRSTLIRLCAPMDYGPSRRAKDKSDRYHFWDFESDEVEHVLSLLPNQIVRIEPSEDSFEPAEFIGWDTQENPWFLARDWGQFS